MKAPDTYDNTMLTTAASCDRKLYLFCRRLKSKETPAYFTFGIVWQECLEVWYTTEGDIGTRLKAALDWATKAWADAGSPHGAKDNLENLIFMLTVYAIEYDHEQWNLIPYKGKMELGFQFPLEGTPWFLAGAVDGSIEWGAYGRLVLENKTAGVPLSDSYMSQWGFSSQVKQYFWGFSQLLGEPPFGVLMNCAYKGTSIKARDAFRTKLEVPEGMFCRDLVKLSPFKIKEFEEDTTRLIERIVNEFEHMHFPKTHNPIECSGGPGRSACEFRRLCLADEYPWNMDDAELLGADLKFRDGPWEPWLRGTKEEGLEKAQK